VKQRQYELTTGAAEFDTPVHCEATRIGMPGMYLYLASVMGGSLASTEVHHEDCEARAPDMALA
jgi:hypothetical protein